MKGINMSALNQKEVRLVDLKICEKEPKLVEFKIREVGRYIVTRFIEDEDGNSESSEIGTFANDSTAYEVGYAMAKQYHRDLGWGVGDERIQYPQMPDDFKNPVPGAISA